jgi:hypothetical protein
MLDAAVSSWCTALRDVTRIRAGLGLREGVMTLRLTADLASGAEVASWLSGIDADASKSWIPAAPSRVAFVSAAFGELGAGSLAADAVQRVLGSRLDPHGVEVIANLGTRFDEAFSGPATLAFLADEPSGGALVLRGPLGSPSSVTDLMKEVAVVLELPAVEAPLEFFGGGALRVRLDPASRRRGISRLQIGFGRSSPGSNDGHHDSGFEFAWSEADGIGTLVVTRRGGFDVLRTLTLARIAEGDAVAASLRAEGATTLLSTALRLPNPSGGRGPPGWLVLAAGRRERQPYFRIDAEATGLNALVRGLAVR